MKINGTSFRSVWVDEKDQWSIHIFDQTRLPFSLDILRLTTVQDVAHAITSMQVRGAPLIGAVAAYGLALALRTDNSDTSLEQNAAMLAATRPTAINLRWALERMLNTSGPFRQKIGYPLLMQKPCISAMKTPPKMKLLASMALNFCRTLLPKKNKASA